MTAGPTTADGKFTHLVKVAFAIFHHCKGAFSTL